MSIDEMLTHYRKGVLTQAEAVKWIEQQIEYATVTAKLDLIARAKGAEPRTMTDEEREQFDLRR